MNALRVAWEFLVDLIIGDDPKIAASVVLAVGLAAIGVVTGLFSAGVVTVGGAVLVVAAFTISLFLDVRP
ncbi:MAG: hypothetical protein ABJA81_03350 [Nocardioidaceae bacterium]